MRNVKAGKPTAEEQVADYYKKLQHPLKPVAEALRVIILSANPAIAEQIKWNSPAFYYTGTMQPFHPKEYKRDIVVCDLHQADRVLLVFPTGASVTDTTGLLEGNYADGRRTAVFTTTGQVATRAADLQAVLKV